MDPNAVRSILIEMLDAPKPKSDDPAFNDQVWYPTLLSFTNTAELTRLGTYLETRF